MTTCTDPNACDCGWAQNGCGNNDGSVCWNCCCTNGGNNNGNVNGNNNNNNNNGGGGNYGNGGDGGLAGRWIVVILIIIGMIVGGYLLWKRKQEGKYPFEDQDNVPPPPSTPAVAIRTIETTGSEPNLPERDTNVPEKDPPVLKEKLARPVVGKIPVRPTEDTSKDIPRPTKYIVYKKNVDLFSDPICENKRTDVKGVILETIRTDDKGETHTSYDLQPTTKNYYQEKDSVAWKWSFDNKWGKTFYKSTEFVKKNGYLYKDPDTSNIIKAFDSSAEFVGRPIKHL